MFQKIEDQETVPNSFYKANITLVPKTDKDITRKQQTNILYEYKSKSPQQKPSNPNLSTYKKDYTPQQGEIYPKKQDLFAIKIRQCSPHHFNKIKDKNSWLSQ